MRQFRSSGPEEPEEGAGSPAVGRVAVGEAAAGGKSPDKTPPGEKAVEVAAVALLARREHSVEELRRKLLGKRHPAAQVEAVIARLAARKLLSDTRFTDHFVHHHARRGQGPIRIRAELRQQGVADETISQALASAEVDWKELATGVRRRKFGAGPARSLPERAKQARFLQYRGFESDQIRAALNSDVESDGSASQADAGFDLDLDS